MTTVNDLVKIYYPNETDVPLNELIKKIVETKMPRISYDKIDEIKSQILSSIPPDTLKNTPKTTIDQFVYLLNMEIKKSFYANNNVESKTSPTMRELLLKMSENKDPMLDTTSDVFIQMTVNQVISSIMETLKQNNMSGDYINQTYEELVGLVTDTIINTYNSYVSPEVITQLSDTVARILSQKLVANHNSLNNMTKNNLNNNSNYIPVDISNSNNNSNYIPVDISNSFNNTTLSISPAITMNNNTIPIPRHLLNSQNTKIELYQSADKLTEYYYLPEYNIFIPVNKTVKSKNSQMTYTAPPATPTQPPKTPTQTSTTSPTLDKLKQINNKPSADIELDSKVVDYLYDVANDDTAKKIIYLISILGIIVLTIALLIIMFKN